MGGPPDPGAGHVYVTISGEFNALIGYPFPPANWQTATYMVDGWRFSIAEYIVAVDRITLWANPDVSATDQAPARRAQVAHLDGPFVVDLRKGGTLVGQGGSPEQATALGTFTSTTRTTTAAPRSTPRRRTGSASARWRRRTRAAT